MSGWKHSKPGVLGGVGLISGADWEGLGGGTGILSGSIHMESGPETLRGLESRKEFLDFFAVDFEESWPDVFLPSVSCVGGAWGVDNLIAIV